MSDLERIDKPGWISLLKHYLFPRGDTFRFVVWMRIFSGVKKRKLLRMTIGPIVYYIFRHYEFKYGIHVNTNAEIGEGILIEHGNVYLQCKYIGKHFTCFQNVTLGNSKGGVPTVMDNVTVFAGAMVVGDVTLGCGCRVGAMSLVLKDVAEGATVVGIPAE